MKRVLTLQCDHCVQFTPFLNDESDATRTCVSYAPSLFPPFFPLFSPPLLFFPEKVRREVHMSHATSWLSALSRKRVCDGFNTKFRTAFESRGTALNLPPLKAVKYAF